MKNLQTMTEFFSTVEAGEKQLEDLLTAVEGVRTRLHVLLNGATKGTTQSPPVSAKQRTWSCDGPGNRRLSDKQAARVRSLYKTGNWTHATLANKFKCSTFTISCAIHREGAYA